MLQAIWNSWLTTKNFLFLGLKSPSCLEVFWRILSPGPAEFTTSSYLFSGLHHPWSYRRPRHRQPASFLHLLTYTYRVSYRTIGLVSVTNLNLPVSPLVEYPWPRCPLSSFVCHLSSLSQLHWVRVSHFGPTHWCAERSWDYSHENQPRDIPAEHFRNDFVSLCELLYPQNTNFWPLMTSQACSASHPFHLKLNRCLLLLTTCSSVVLGEKPLKYCEDWWAGSRHLTNNGEMRTASLWTLSSDDFPLLFLIFRKLFSIWKVTGSRAECVFHFWEDDCFFRNVGRFPINHTAVRSLTWKALRLILGWRWFKQKNYF